MFRLACQNIVPAQTKKTETYGQGQSGKVLTSIDPTLAAQGHQSPGQSKGESPPTLKTPSQLASGCVGIKIGVSAKAICIWERLSPGGHLLGDASFRSRTLGRGASRRCV